MEFNYNKCPECGYVNKNQPDVCPSCGCDLKAYRDELQAQEEAFEAAEQARKEAEQARMAELVNKAYPFICDTMDGMTKTEDVNKDFLVSFIAAFLDGSNVAKFESSTERHISLLLALYRYYDEKKDEPNDNYGNQGQAILDCYIEAICLMGLYISSSKNNRLKSIVGFWTPAYGIKCFFDLIIAELEFVKKGISPFKDEFTNVRQAMPNFLYRFVNDDELSSNDELNALVEQYGILLHDHYEEFSDFEFDGWEKDEYGDTYGWYDEDTRRDCPHCGATIRLIDVADKEATYHDKVKCAACKKTFMISPMMECPECSYYGIYEHPFGINSTVCERCGLKYEVAFTAPEDDEGAIDSVLDDGSET